jgi:hypothetical protein
MMLGIFIYLDCINFMYQIHFLSNSFLMIDSVLIDNKMPLLMV